MLRPPIFTAGASGLTSSTPDPEGGRIYKDESGNFTGLLSYVSTLPREACLDFSKLCGLAFGLTLFLLAFLSTVSFDF